MNNLVDFNSDLSAIIDECRKYVTCGKVANYIPELAKVDVNKLGIYIISKDEAYFSGDYETLLPCKAS